MKKISKSRKFLIMFLSLLLLLVIIFIICFLIQHRNNTDEDSSDSLIYSTNDEVSGKTFVTDDNREMILLDDGTFKYYEISNDYTGSYVEGTYEVYCAEEAKKQIISMSEYGITEDELNSILEYDLNNGISLDITGLSELYEEFNITNNNSALKYSVNLGDFYAIIIKAESVYYSDGEKEELNRSILFIGYYISDINTMKLTNCNVARNVLWVEKGR
ncbi:MAG: hypothetical protein IJ763_09220 [Lachnospiraceae bacterium]|nr:hypothetical protein [Lachnospiraceae bacterium]